jgi:hypothetical protein
MMNVSTINSSNAFREIARQRPKETPDDSVRLLCTVPGCGALWSVLLDKPMCSFHQWGGSPQRGFVNMANVPKVPSDGTDGKAWARRIVRVHESGQLVRTATLDLARLALAGRGA